MPTKSKVFAGVKFTPAAIREANLFVARLEDAHRSRLSAAESREPTDEFVNRASGRIVRGDETWTFDHLEEFLGAYRDETISAASLELTYHFLGWIRVEFFGGTSTVSVTRHTRPDVERVFDFFEEDVPRARLADPTVAIEKAVRIFIGHGRQPAWRDLKDHLQDQHRFTVSTYETGSRAGYTIKEVLEEMVNRASFALLVHTGEDENAGGTLHARQNVVHETGLFQGRLGFRRAIILREEGCEGFSNVIGTAEIRYAKGNIRETFGDVVATIHREFGAPR